MKVRILFIEDEEDLRHNMAEILELNGFDVVTADNGLVALESISKVKFDLVICDIMMPVMDGFQFLEVLRSNPKLINLPVIFLTAKATSKDQRAGMEKGAEDYLVKPVSSKNLLNAIQVALQKKKHRELFIAEAIQKALSSERNIKYHELRTPLFGLMSILEYLLNELENLDQSEIRQFLEKADFSAKKLSQVLSKLAIFQRITELLPQEQEIPSIIGFIENIGIDEKSLGIQWNHPENDFSLNFDPEQLKFIVMEICQNAEKFSTTPEDLIQIHVLNNRALRVSNTQNHLPVNFELQPRPFYQPERNYSEHQGLGLGLYISMEYCKKNQGKLTCWTDQKGDFQAQIQF